MYCAKTPISTRNESEFGIIEAVKNIDPVQLIENTVNNNGDLKSFLYCCLAKNSQERSSSSELKNSYLYLKYRDKTSQFVEALISPFWWKFGIHDNISEVLSKFALFCVEEFVKAFYFFIIFAILIGWFKQSWLSIIFS